MADKITLTGGAPYTSENAPTNLPLPPNTRLATFTEADSGVAGGSAVTLSNGALAWLMPTVESTSTTLTGTDTAPTAISQVTNVNLFTDTTGDPYVLNGNSTIPDPGFAAIQANVVNTITGTSGTVASDTTDSTFLNSNKPTINSAVAQAQQSSNTDANAYISGTEGTTQGFGLGTTLSSSPVAHVEVGSSNANVTNMGSVVVSSSRLPPPNPDWRVKLTLASNADYLYAAAKDVTDILYPLARTNGVIFPYTPTIQTAYRANYDPTELTHSNYKLFFYKNSAVDDVTISCDFTAQDNSEASYLLAVIHFFKSATKMFYGQDTAPAAGTPPPLVYLTGLGEFQYNQHPMAITSFTYSLPNDVDYIRAYAGGANSGSMTGSLSLSPNRTVAPGFNGFIASRLNSAKLTKGAIPSTPAFTVTTGKTPPTYVPTKISLSITCIPIVTRYDVTNNFSLKEYANGSLLVGANNSNKGGFW